MEFVEVIKQKGRMCNSTKECTNCPLSINNNGKDIRCGMFMITYPEKTEEIIMKWAEKHPIKINREVFTEIMQEKFGDAFNLNKLQVVLEENGCTLFNGNCDGNCKTCDQYNFWDYEYKEVEKDADSR